MPGFQPYKPTPQKDAQSTTTQRALECRKRLLIGSENPLHKAANMPISATLEHAGDLRGLRALTKVKHSTRVRACSIRLTKIKIGPVILNR